MKDADVCPSGYRKIDNKCKMVVVFRKFKDKDVIALFPDVEADMSGNCMSYQHIGQHGSAEYNYVIYKTKPATKREYKPLLNELTNLVGYEKSELEIRKKRIFGK